MTFNYNLRPPIQLIYDGPSKPPVQLIYDGPSKPIEQPIQAVYDAPYNPGGGGKIPSPWNPWQDQPSPWKQEPWNPWQDQPSPWKQEPSPWTPQPSPWDQLMPWDGPKPWDKPIGPPVQAVYDAPVLPFQQQSQWFS